MREREGGRSYPTDKHNTLELGGLPLHFSRLFSSHTHKHTNICNTILQTKKGCFTPQEKNKRGEKEVKLYKNTIKNFVQELLQNLFHTHSKVRASVCLCAGVQYNPSNFPTPLCVWHFSWFLLASTRTEFFFYILERKPSRHFLTFIHSFLLSNQLRILIHELCLDYVPSVRDYQEKSVTKT